MVLIDIGFSDNILPALVAFFGIAVFLRHMESFGGSGVNSPPQGKKPVSGPVRPLKRISGIIPATRQNGLPDPDPEPEPEDIPTQDDIVLLDDDEKETLERARIIRTKIDARIAALQSAGLEITNLDKKK